MECESLIILYISVAYSVPYSFRVFKVRVRVRVSNSVRVSVFFILLHKTCAWFTLKQYIIAINVEIFTEDDTSHHYHVPNRTTILPGDKENCPMLPYVGLL